VATSSSRFVVTADDHGSVRLLTLTRPDKLNSFTAEGYRVLRAALDDAATDPAVAVCVLTGAGRAFSAGVDLSEVSSPEGSAELGVHFDPLLDSVARFPKPLLAAVNGLAVGFGATLLLHCDLVILDETAEVRMPFVALGTCAEAASSWLLPRRVGQQQASWMILSGAALSADDAVASGFALATAPVGRVVDEALERARQLAAHGIAALVANKRLLREGWAETITDVWRREKAAMLAIREELGPIGWTDRH
jgi:enoyl-CoA hydratase/carnithine racemase